MAVAAPERVALDALPPWCGFDEARFERLALGVGALWWWPVLARGLRSEWLGALQDALGPAGLDPLVGGAPEASPEGRAHAPQRPASVDEWRSGLERLGRTLLADSLPDAALRTLYRAALAPAPDETDALLASGEPGWAERAVTLALEWQAASHSPSTLSGSPAEAEVAVRAADPAT